MIMLCSWICAASLLSTWYIYFYFAGLFHVTRNEFLHCVSSETKLPSYLTFTHPLFASDGTGRPLAIIALLLKSGTMRGACRAGPLVAAARVIS